MWHLCSPYKLGLVLAKAQYLIITHVFHACLNPIQTGQKLIKFLNEKSEIQNKEETVKIFADRFEIRAKKLSESELAVNNALETVEWNFWTRYQKNGRMIHLNVNSLTQNHLAFLNNISSSTIQFAEDVLAKLKVQSLPNNLYVDLLKNIVSQTRNLNTCHDIISCSVQLQKKNVKVFIAKDHSIFIEETFLDKGTYKKVFSGKALMDDRDIAILEVEINNDQVKAATKKELKILQKLKGIPGIVQVYGSYKKRDENKRIIIEEFCNEGALLYHIDSLSKHERRDVAIQLLFIMQEIHKAGIRYCDMKPDNVLIKRNRETNTLTVHLGDFGMAMELGVTNPRGGTPDFMAPEVLCEVLGKGQPIHDIHGQIKAEIFELGVVFLQLFDFNNALSFSSTPWTNEITKLLSDRSYQIKDLKDEIYRLSNLIIPRAKKVSDSEKKFYKTIAAMVNPYDPLVRPDLEDVMQQINNISFDTEELPKKVHEKIGLDL